ncbi:VOC family protein [uncultured Cellulomonas sp.]|uniref:VOC family protein n=1 Tax=uncultured Cellulomonas sp. TaxID=189682 RepID=UPI00262ED13C|nr:VOC family protein [uncultured Cellulomonas sp.]
MTSAAEVTTAAGTTPDVRLGSAFIPVADPPAAARWYSAALGLTVEETTEHAAVLGSGASRVTLMGPASGIRATPGLEWASCSFVAADLVATTVRLAAAGADPSDVQGSADRCLFVTARDPDGNVLLVVDR